MKSLHKILYNIFWITTIFNFISLYFVGREIFYGEKTSELMTTIITLSASTTILILVAIAFIERRMRKHGYEI